MLKDFYAAGIGHVAAVDMWDLRITCYPVVGFTTVEDAVTPAIMKGLEVVPALSLTDEHPRGVHILFHVADCECTRLMDWCIMARQYIVDYAKQSSDTIADEFDDVPDSIKEQILAYLVKRDRPLG
jgi:hypothetical protein